MILPIYLYGQNVLRKEGEYIQNDYPKLQELIQNMFETMYNAHGVGLAAPQVGLAIRLFVIDAKAFVEDEEYDGEKKDFKKVFINLEILEEKGKVWEFEEGCLSIPGIREDVSRKESITVKYWDENFVEHTETLDGIFARIIQHEHDHTLGKLFIDYINPLKRRMLKGRLNDLTKGRTNADYPVKIVR